MDRKIKVLALVTTMLVAGVFGQAKSQDSSVEELRQHLERRMTGSEAVKIITEHLAEHGGAEPLNEIVAWAKNGFPDLHEGGRWKTDADSLRAGVVASIHYYFERSSSQDKSERYFEILEQLHGDAQMVNYLTLTAHLTVDEQALESEVESLLRQKDPSERTRGLWLGHMLARKEGSTFERYLELLGEDDDGHVRATILAIVGLSHQKKVALIFLDRLLNDSSPEVRDRAARSLRSYAELQVLSKADLPGILYPMVKANDPFVRESLGRVAALLATDRELSVKESEITDQLLVPFVELVHSKVQQEGKAITKEQLTRLWVTWWAPLIPRYTERIQITNSR